ncbi:MAG TPA: GGDEF domain-containing protein [Gemmataceae bacterium]
MDKATETWITAPRRPASPTTRDACLVHIYPTGPTMGARYALTNQAVVVGRGDDCTIQIHDHSVSRRHARIEHAADGFRVHDLQSTNGSFVNDRPVVEALLHDGDYLRVGNCIFRFLAGGNVESEYHEEIYRLTIIDGLTQIHNQRYLIEFLDRELARSARHQRPLALILFDIDWFKTINDELGHLGGDFTLRELAGCVKKTVRREDLFARYGGEEFALVLVETSQEGAAEVAERIRQSVEKHPFRFEEKPFSLTISLGVAFTPGDATLTAAGLLRQADDKMYQAKRAGRKRVVC